MVCAHTDDDDSAMMWHWSRKIYYWAITVWCYVRLGLSLVEVKARHSLLRPIRIFYREHRCRWWALFCASWDSDADIISVQGCLPASSGRETGMGGTRDGLVRTHQPLDDVDIDQTRSQEACAVRILLHRLLRECQDLVHITHGEAVEVRLMRMMMRQCDALCECTVPNNDMGCTSNSVRGSKCRCRSDANVMPSDSPDEKDDTMFLLSESDPSYAQALQTGRPVRVSYAQALDCVHTLSQIVAWELFILSRSAPRCVASRTAGRLAMSGPMTKRVTSEAAQATAGDSDTKKHDEDQGEGVTTAVDAVEQAIGDKKFAFSSRQDRRGESEKCGQAIQSSCVALMIPNSVEFNLIWLACARAGTLETIMDHLYSDTGSLSISWDRSTGHTGRLDTNGTFDVKLSLAQCTPLLHTCEIALLNTNLVSNDMLFHALDCVGCVMVILDVRYAYLLFVAGQSHDEHTNCNTADSVSTMTGANNPDISDTQRNMAKKQEEQTTSAPMLAQRLHVPSTVRRICLWRGGHDAEDATRAAHEQPSSQKMNDATTFTTDMRHEIDRFNTNSYAQAPAMLEHAYASRTNMEQAAQKRNRSSEPPAGVAPLLDLSSLLPRRDSTAPSTQTAGDVADSEKEDKTRCDAEPRAASKRALDPQQASPVCRQNSADSDRCDAHRCEYHARIMSFQYLVSAILSHPPLWLTRFTKRDEVTSSTSTCAMDDCLLPVPHSPTADSLHTVTSCGVPAVDSVCGTQSTLVLVGRTRFAQRLRKTLQIFHPAQTLMYIYTSGTTGGRPKAARFSHLRFLSTCFLSRVMHLRQQTRRLLGRSSSCCCSPTRDALDVENELNRITIYNCLPMYHTVGCVFCLGHLMHALEEQQQQQQSALRRRLWCANSMRHALTSSQLGRWWRRYAPTSWFASRFPVSLSPRDERISGSRSQSAEVVHHEPVHKDDGNSAQGETRRGTVPRRVRVPSARMVLRTHFSASRFYEDLQRYHVTVVQYIGEILRYAVLFERSHPRPGLTRRAEATNLGDVVREGVVDAIEGAGAGQQRPMKDGSGSTSQQSRTNQLRIGAETDLARDSVELPWQVPFAFGNGLRKDVWDDCIAMLHIALPVEFYSSTEGNIFLFNLFGIPGVIGHIARFPGPLNYLLSMHYLPVFPFRVVRFDESTQELWRDARSGFGARARVNEVGEILGEIVNGFDLFGLRRFDGYSSSSSPPSLTAHRVSSLHSGAPRREDASKRKVASHVLWPASRGMYFCSGDLVKFDDFGFCTFVDRVGETFRWKGENVSTTEVSDALLLARGRWVEVQEVVVYGVTVPDSEGRAGMALLQLICRRNEDHVIDPSTNRDESNTDRSSDSYPMNKDTRDDKDKSSTKDRNADGGGRGIDAGKHADAASAACVQPTLLQERLFLQNELYTCITSGATYLSHTRADQSATAAERGVLPRYAVPLFVRIDDAAMMSVMGDRAGDARKDRANKEPGPEPASVDAPKEQKMTSTFKYRKFLLSKEGFRLALNGDFLADWWGDDDAAHKHETRAAVAMQATTRVYVLMTNFTYRDALTIQPRPDEAHHGYYVPLTTRTMKVLGNSLRACGW